jgi:uncharacterized protein (DUF934 family)
MPRIIQGGKITEDGWVQLADDTPVPADGDVIVSFKRWTAEREALLARDGRTGVRLVGGDSLDALAPDLPRLPVVALAFPNFKDGRSFSFARLLRERYGYTGQLRAVGDVLRDQIFYMRRCGIDTLELRADKSAEDALKAFGELTVAYQAAVDEKQPLFRRVHRVGPN